jgi:hypothetical protein
MSYDTTLRVCSPVDPDALMTAAVQATGGKGRGKRFGFDDGITMLHASIPAGTVSVHYAARGGLYPSEPGDRAPDAYAVVLLVSGSGRRQQERQRQAAAAIGAWCAQQGARWAWRDLQAGGRWVVSGRSAGRG